MNHKKEINQKRKLRKRRTRAKFERIETPRLSVFRSNKHIYAQVIDDTKNKTLAFSSSKKNKHGKNENKTESAKKVGKEIAEIAKKSGVEKVVFDKGHYAYHGRVKALAEEARKGGLKF